MAFPPLDSFMKDPGWQTLIGGQMAGLKIRPFDGCANVSRPNPIQLIEKDRSAQAGLIETQHLAEIDDGRWKQLLHCGSKS